MTFQETGVAGAMAEGRQDVREDEESSMLGTWHAGVGGRKESWARVVVGWAGPQL